MRWKSKYSLRIYPCATPHLRWRQCRQSAWLCYTV